MISYNKNYFYFILFFLVLSINELQATITSGLQKRKYTNAHNMKNNEHSSIPKENKSLENNRIKRKNHTYVAKEINIDRLQSSPGHKNLLLRLSVKKESNNNIYEKLFEKKFKDKEKQIKDNKMMIAKVDTRLARLINDYNKMSTRHNLKVQ